MRLRRYRFVEISNKQLTAPLGAALRQQDNRALMYKGSLYEAPYHAFMFLQSGSPAGADCPYGCFADVRAR
jgi:hypothetical protein